MGLYVLLKYINYFLWPGALQFSSPRGTTSKPSEQAVWINLEYEVSDCVNCLYLFVL